MRDSEYNANEYMATMSGSTESRRATGVWHSPATSGKGADPSPRYRQPAGVAPGPLTPDWNAPRPLPEALRRAGAVIDHYIADYFAAQAMSYLIGIIHADDPVIDLEIPEVAETAYRYADAMLSERAK